MPAARKRRGKTFLVNSVTRKTGIDAVQRRHFTVLENCLIHPTSFDGINFIRRSQYIVKPERYAELSTLPFFRCVQVDPIRLRILVVASPT